MEHALYVVAFNAGQERLVRWVRRSAGSNIGTVAVFGRYEVETLFSGRVRCRLEKLVQPRFPDHVAYAVADEKEEIYDVRRKGRDVECQRANFRNVCP